MTNGIGHHPCGGDAKSAPKKAVPVRKAEKPQQEKPPKSQS
jgi:hypothetical protein